VSRTGLVVRHSPRFRLTPDPGAFRVDAYEAPQSPALRQDVPSPPQPPAPPIQTKSEAPAEKGEEDKAQGELQILSRSLSEGRALEPGRRGAAGTGAVPRVRSDDLLVSELTAEGKAPAVEIAYRRTGGGK
jgi:hypothetical protein